VGYGKIGSECTKPAISLKRGLWNAAR